MAPPRAREMAPSLRHHRLLRPHGQRGALALRIPCKGCQRIRTHSLTRGGKSSRMGSLAPLPPQVGQQQRILHHPPRPRSGEACHPLTQSTPRPTTRPSRYRQRSGCYSTPPLTPSQHRIRQHPPTPPPPIAHRACSLRPRLGENECHRSCPGSRLAKPQPFRQGFP